MTMVMALLLTSLLAFAQKPGIGKYSSKEPAEKVFTAAVQAAGTIQFSVKNSNKAEGTIQGEMYVVGGNGKVVNLFVTVIREGDHTMATATFNKPWGTTGNLSKIAQAYGDEIKKIITDLEIEIVDPKKKK